MLLEDFRHSKFFTTSTSANQLRNFWILIKPLSLFVKYSSLQTTSKKFRLQQHEVFHHLESGRQFLNVQEMSNLKKPLCKAPRSSGLDP